MIDFTTLLVDGVPLIVVIFGLVEFSKQFGLKGTWLSVLSMLLGLVFGVCYKFAASGVPIGFASWFAVVVFGLALGLTASGFYDFVDKRTMDVGP
jgi:hypothetical protein